MNLLLLFKMLNVKKEYYEVKLIDNIEDIDDSEIFLFLKNIPSPGKVLLTSRVRRYKELPAERIFIPEMNEVEATELLFNELDKIEYHNYLNEKEDYKKIIEVSGCLPLAIKWSASLAGTYKSLKEVSTQLRSQNVTKKEFLDFCYNTMFNKLSEVARDAALLCPYLSEDWNIHSVAIALDQSDKTVEEAIDELEDKGLISQSISKHKNAYSISPLTLDYLSNKWHQNKSFREKITKNIANAVSSPYYSVNLFDLPAEQKIEALYYKANLCFNEKEYQTASKLIKLALQYISEKEDRYLQKLLFLEGKIFYKLNKRSDGISRMHAAINNNVNSFLNQDDDYIFLAQAILYHGESKYENFALTTIINHIENSTIINRELIKEFCSKSMSNQNYRLISDLIDHTRNNPDYSYWIVKEIWEHLNNKQTIFMIGKKNSFSVKECFKDKTSRCRRN